RREASWRGHNLGASVTAAARSVMARSQSGRKRHGSGEKRHGEVTIWAQASRQRREASWRGHNLGASVTAAARSVMARSQSGRKRHGSGEKRHGGVTIWAQASRQRREASWRGHNLTG